MISLRGYRLTHLIESIGSVQVYTGVRDEDGQQVIAKVYRPDDDPDLAAELERRYHLVSEIESDGIIQTLALERTGEVLVLVTEAFEGLTIGEYAARHSVTTDIFLTIAVQLARTLCDIHDAGVIHKDLKPANVLIDPYQLRVRITGFEISVEASSQDTNPDMRVLQGTLPYLSPEQTGRMRRRIDFRSDLYSLGITLFELATGAPPFNGAEPLEIVHAHLARQPESPSLLNADFPEMLSRIVLKLLEKEPEDRYQSAAAVLADLHRCQDLLDERGRIPEFEIGTRAGAATLRPSERIYGRQFEAGVVKHAFADVKRVRELRLVMLSGPPGVGKTALVEDLTRELVEEEDVLFVRGRFDPYTNTAPYSGFREAISSFCDQILTESDASLFAWRARLLEALTPITQVAVELVPKLGWILGPQPPVPEVGALQAQRRLMEVAQRLAVGIAGDDKPLVLFLDDMQWADEGSLSLIEGLVGAPDPIPVLVIGAYRHGDVGVEHLLAASLERLWELDPTARAIRLQPLRVSDVNALVADSLGRNPRETMSLTELIARKTDNNPLFVKQFLVYACQLGLLQDEGEGGWTWDLQAMEMAGIPDDVAGMMTDKIGRLPLRVQRVLKYASIAGMSFDFDTLLAIDPARDDQRDHLDKLVEEGLISKHGDGYRFTHERIREAVHNLIPPVEAARLCRLVGRYRLLAGSPETLADRIFDVVDLLNQAKALIHDERERVQLIELNLMASQQARSSAVYSSAETYLEVAIGLVVEEDWVERTSLCFDLYVTAADVARFSGRLDRSEELCQELLARDLPDPLAAEVCASMVSLHEMQGQPERAVKVGLLGLRRIGAHATPNPSRLRVLWEVARSAFALWRHREEDWSSLEPATDERWIAERTIVSEMCLGAYFADRNLMTMLVSSGLRRLITLGYHISPSLSVAGFGLILGHGFGRFQRGYEYGQLALRLLERYPEAPGSLRARFVIHGLINPWVRHWRDSVGPLERLSHQAAELGDTPTAVHCMVQQGILRFLTGEPLQDVEEHAHSATERARAWGLEAVAWSLETLGTGAYCLRGMPDDVDVEALLHLTRLKTLKVHSAYFEGVTIGALVLSVLGRFEEALACARKIDLDDERWCIPSPMGAEHLLVRALATAASDESQGWKDRRKTRHVLRICRKRLRKWGRAGPVNFEPRLRFVEAELARLDGRFLEAMDAYTRARISAANSGLLHIRALALEREASLAAAQGWHLETRTYLTKARSTYAAWGAMAKVGQLDERYADFLKTRPNASATPTSAMSLAAHTGTDSPLVFQAASALDLSTVMATARALSEEVALENVVERVLVSAIENAGANRGLLLLAEDGTLLLEAECAVDGNYRHYRPSLPIEDCTARLPVSVVRFVTRTAETVVLGDASHRGMFTGDSYVAGTGSRSILCVPILKRTKLVGVLYLENTLVARAFTDERLSVLRLVAAQAAISLENARLIEELRRARDGLEQRVAERTQELVALQDDLVAAARRAGMAEVATGVLHNVGNILNSVNTSVADLEEVLRYSRLPSLERTLELLREHQDDLGTFIGSDPRGQLVPEFLRLVSEQLGTEHHRMREDVAQLSQNVEHVRHVISAQQAFAGVSGVVEELVITELIDEAIRICGATRPWRDQRIVREVEEVPMVQMQRHQVLQILVNLIANARDALDDQVDAGDLRIIIGAKQMGDRVHISVRDFGVGIAPENLDRVFNHGFTTKKTGHGFGLHSSAIAARQMGGELRVESDGPARGATFTLELPVSQSFHSGRERLPRTRRGPGTP